MRPHRTRNTPGDAPTSHTERSRKLSDVYRQIRVQYVDTVENAGLQRAEPVDNPVRLIVGQGSLW